MVGFVSSTIGSVADVVLGVNWDVDRRPNRLNNRLKPPLPPPRRSRLRSEQAARPLSLDRPLAALGWTRAATAATRRVEPGGASPLHWSLTTNRVADRQGPRRRTGRPWPVGRSTPRPCARRPRRSIARPRTRSRPATRSLKSRAAFENEGLEALGRGRPELDNTNSLGQVIDDSRRRACLPHDVGLVVWRVAGRGLRRPDRLPLNRYADAGDLDRGTLLRDRASRIGRRDQIVGRRWTPVSFATVIGPAPSTPLPLRCRHQRPQLTTLAYRRRQTAAGRPPLRPLDRRLISIAPSCHRQAAAEYQTPSGRVGRGPMLSGLILSLNPSSGAGTQLLATRSTTRDRFCTLVRATRTARPPPVQLAYPDVPRRAAPARRLPQQRRRPPGTDRLGSPLPRDRPRGPSTAAESCRQSSPATAMPSVAAPAGTSLFSCPRADRRLRFPRPRCSARWWRSGRDPVAHGR